jgi:hypothetical protein
MARASVMAGAIETSYRRAGRGATVVVLTGGQGFPSTDEAALQPMLARARVVVPDHTTITALAACWSVEETPFGCWLDGFLEGIGADGIRLVAPIELTYELQQFVATHPGAVARCVLLGEQGPELARWADAVRLPATATWQVIADAALGDRDTSAPG